MTKRTKMEEFKEEHCEYCSDSHSCKDLDGDLIDDQVKICMEVDK